MFFLIYFMCSIKVLFDNWPEWKLYFYENVLNKSSKKTVNKWSKSERITSTYKTFGLNISMKKRKTNKFVDSIKEMRKKKSNKELLSQKKVSFKRNLSTKTIATLFLCVHFTSAHGYQYSNRKHSWNSFYHFSLSIYIGGICSNTYTHV